MDSGSLPFLLISAVLLLVSLLDFRTYLEILKYSFSGLDNGVDVHAFLKKFIGFVDEAMISTLFASFGLNIFGSSAEGTVKPYIADSNVIFKKVGSSFCDIVESFATNNNVRISLSNYITQNQKVKIFLQIIRSALPETVYDISFKHLIDLDIAIFDKVISLVTFALSQTYY